MERKGTREHAAIAPHRKGLAGHMADPRMPSSFIFWFCRASHSYSVPIKYLHLRRVPVVMSGHWRNCPCGTSLGHPITAWGPWGPEAWPGLLRIDWVSGGRVQGGHFRDPVSPVFCFLRCTSGGLLGDRTFGWTSFPSLLGERSRELWSLCCCGEAKPRSLGPRA